MTDTEAQISMTTLQKPILAYLSQWPSRGTWSWVHWHADNSASSRALHFWYWF